MKKTIFPFLIFTMSFCLIEAEQTDIAPEKGILLVTYPRSGTNWTIGILQILCKRPVRFLDPKRSHPLGENRLGFKVDESLPFVFRSHKVTNIVKALNKPSFSLIFILRNYKECIVKENKLSPEQFLKAVIDNKSYVANYFDNLRFFDSIWNNPKTKHLIVYEEMILNPQKEIVSLLTFLGEDLTGIPKFMEKYDEWNKAMLTSYHHQHANFGPPSNNELIFHCKDFPKKELMKVDAIIKDRYPDLWFKYLKRYAETKTKAIAP